MAKFQGLTEARRELSQSLLFQNEELRRLINTYEMQLAGIHKVASEALDGMVSKSGLPETPRAGVTHGSAPIVASHEASSSVPLATVSSSEPLAALQSLPQVAASSQAMAEPTAAAAKRVRWSAPMAERIDEASDPPCKHRRTNDGAFDTKAEFYDYYRPDTRAAWSWALADPPSNEDSPENMEDASWAALARLLWRGRIPRHVLAFDGDYYMSAEIVPTSDAVENLFRICHYYRSQVLQAQSGGAAEPAEAAELTGEQLGEAWALWRADFRQGDLRPHQEQMLHENPKVFKKCSRSWHNAYVRRVFGSTHIADALLQYGSQTREALAQLAAAVEHAKCAARDKAEPHNKREQRCLRTAALRARTAFRQGRALTRRVDGGGLYWDDLSAHHQKLVNGFISRRLHREVDQANRAYGHGVARTNDFGFPVGGQMGVLPDISGQALAALGWSSGGAESLSAPLQAWV